ncbi:MAG: hypothetical protein AB7V39_11855 [Nitrospiraceae bacterium]
MYSAFYQFPDELLPLVEEFRKRVSVLLGTPRLMDPFHLTDSMLLWWSPSGEMGIGDASQKEFRPILITSSDPDDRVTVYTTLDEVQSMMDKLRQAMLLDTLAELGDDRADQPVS